jgi:hypothetical protein
VKGGPAASEMKPIDLLLSVGSDPTLRGRLAFDDLGPGLAGQRSVTLLVFTVSRALGKPSVAAARYDVGYSIVCFAPQFECPLPRLNTESLTSPERVSVVSRGWKDYDPSLVTRAV